MSTMRISLFQALSVWSELEQAYYGDNKYGGDTAEIYAYRLMEHSPMLNQDFRTQASEEAKIAAAKIAGFALYELCRHFRDERDCVVEIDGTSKLEEWVMQTHFDHRAHIKIIRRPS